VRRRRNSGVQFVHCAAGLRSTLARHREAFCVPRLVDRGMLDAACPGQVFTSPTPDQMVAAVEAVETGSGCLFIVKNYEGDVMNFQMAAELAGKDSATVVTDDDVPVEKSTWSTGRRGSPGRCSWRRSSGQRRSRRLAVATQGTDLLRVAVRVRR